MGKRRGKEGVGGEEESGGGSGERGREERVGKGESMCNIQGAKAYLPIDIIRQCDSVSGGLEGNNVHSG